MKTIRPILYIYVNTVIKQIPNPNSNGLGDSSVRVIEPFAETLRHKKINDDAQSMIEVSKYSHWLPKRTCVHVNIQTRWIICILESWSQVYYTPPNFAGG